MKRYSKISTLLLLLSCTTLGFAIQPFFQNDCSSNPLTAGWSTSDASGQDMRWEYCTDALSCGLQQNGFNATSADNGFLIMISADNSNLTTNHISRLTAPTIDCTDKNEVYLEFQNFISTFNVHAAIGAKVKVRSDGGAWTIFYPFPLVTDSIGTQAISRNPDKVTLDLSAVAAGHENVEIVWEWEGNYEVFWALDDIKLFEAEPFYENTIWGVHPGQGDFDNGWNGWSHQTVRAVDPNSMIWKWDPYGYVGDARAFQTTVLDNFRDFPYIDAYTGYNGAMVFNADFYTNNIGLGANPPEYHAELISPLIDLSDQIADVALQFTQFALLFAPNLDADYPTSLAVSVDGGRNWRTPIPLNTTLRPNTPINNTVNIPIPDIAGYANVRVKFIFTSPLYFWVIDDVMIVGRKENDLAVRRDFFALAPNAVTPASQVEPFGFLADFENRGLNAQQDAYGTIEIREQPGQALLFTDSIALGTLETNQLVQNIFFKNTYLPQPIAGNYSGTYKIAAAAKDDYPADNAVHWNFTISDSLFAKETGPTLQIRPISGVDFKYGNCFFVPRGYGHVAKNITFGIANAEQLQGKTLITYFYKFYTDANGDNFASGNELELLANNSYEIKGNEQQLSNGIITIPIADTGAGIPLDDNVYYIAAVGYTDFGDAPCRMLASDAYDYLAMWFRSDSLNRPRYAGVEEVNGAFDLLGFNLKYVPLVRFSIGKTTSTTPSLNNHQQLHAFPNPATEKVTITFDDPPHGDISISLTEINGRTVHRDQIQNRGQVRSFDLRLSHLPKGIYFLKVETKSGVMTKKVVVE